MIYRKWWCSIAICNKWLQGSTGFSQCTLHFYQTLCWSSMHRVLIHPHHAQTIHSPCVSTWVCEPASAVKSQAVEDSSNKKLAGNDWRIQPMVQWLWVSLKIGVPQTIGSPKFARGQGSTRIHRFGWSLSNWVCYDASDLATLPSPPKKGGIPASVTAASEHLEQPQRTARTSRTTRKHGPSTSYPIGSGITE